MELRDVELDGETEGDPDIDMKREKDLPSEGLEDVVREEEAQLLTDVDTLGLEVALKRRDVERDLGGDAERLGELDTLGERRDVLEVEWVADVHLERLLHEVADRDRLPLDVRLTKAETV